MWIQTVGCVLFFFSLIADHSQVFSRVSDLCLIIEHIVKCCVIQSDPVMAARVWLEKQLLFQLSNSAYRIYVAESRKLVRPEQRKTLLYE